MPKITDSESKTSVAEYEIAARRLATELDDDDGVLLLPMRIVNDRVEYSLQNRPDATMSGVSDAVLLAALLQAGGNYAFTRRKKLPAQSRIEALRDDGKTISCKDLVQIDFVNERIISTRGKDLTLQALSIVVQNLAASAADGAPPPDPPN